MKSLKMRADAKALILACKALLEAAADGIVTEAMKVEIDTKRAQAKALLDSAGMIEAVESEIGGLDKPIVRERFSADDTAIEPDSESRAEQVHTFGGRMIAKKDAYKIGMLFKLMAHNSGKGTVHADTVRAARDIFGSQMTASSFGDLQAAQIEGSDIAGGALVVPEFDKNVINLREAFGTWRRNIGTIRTMMSEIKRVPRRVSGLQMYLVGESAKITTSSKKWDQVVLQALTCGAIALSSMQLNEDAAIDLGTDLMSELAYAAALTEDQAGWNGDGTTGGTTEYLGMMGVRYKLKNLSATISKIYGLTVGSGSGHTTDYTGLVLTDFEAVVANLPQFADSPNCKWYCHRAFYWNVMVKLALAAGGTQGLQILGGDGIKRYTFLGYPVEFVQVFDKTAAASQVCALFGDLTMAAKMGERKGLEFAVSQDATILDGSTTINLWQQLMMAWRMIERIAINVHDVGTNSDIVATPPADIPGAGPIVGLITAAS